MASERSVRDAGFHPYAWISWLVAAAALPLQSRNPLYLLLVLVAVGIVYQSLPRHSPSARGWGAFLKLGAIVALVAIPFNALTAHYGDWVLFTLPEHWPIIGGIITGEAILFGAASSLALLTLLLVFATFNTAVDQSRLLRLVPAFLLEAGLVAAIAVAFVPQMFLAFRQIREAQQVRGHRIRGLRSFLPLVMPLLTTGLERSVQLAESMEARGFGQGQVPHRAVAAPVKLMAILAMLLLAVGLFALQYTQQWRVAAIVMIVLAGGALAAFIWQQSRGVRRSCYRRWLWRSRDTALVVAGLIPLVAIVAARLLDRWALVYYPYPPFSPLPPFEPWLGAVLIVLAAPALLMPRPVRMSHSVSKPQPAPRAAEDYGPSVKKDQVISS